MAAPTHHGEDTTMAMTRHAAAAAAIRRDLKAAFPTVTFRVRSSSSTGSSSVHVDWTDGPTHGQVWHIVGTYKYGHFDHMTDSYEYSNRREDLPQVTYVFALRAIGPGVFAAAVELLNQTRAGDPLVVDHGPDGRGLLVTAGWEASQEVRRTLEDLPLICRGGHAILPGDHVCPDCGQPRVEARPPGITDIATHREHPTTPTPTPTKSATFPTVADFATAADFAGSLAQAADDDLAAIAAAIEAAGRQPAPALTHVLGFLVLRGIAPGAPTRSMRAEFEVRPGDGGGFAVTVYADSPPELGGDGAAVVAVVPFGPGGDAADALAALLAAVHAADTNRDD